MKEDVMMRALIIHAARWFAHRRGSQNSWRYADTVELEDTLRELLLAKYEKRDTAHAWNAFRDLMYRLHGRPFEPFPGCKDICTQVEQICLYRRAVADFIAAAQEKRVGAFNDAYEADKKAGDGRPNSWGEGKDAAHALIEYGKPYHSAFKRIGLCYVQHMLADRVRPIHDLELEALKGEADKSTNGG